RRDRKSTWSCTPLRWSWVRRGAARLTSASPSRLRRPSRSETSRPRSMRAPRVMSPLMPAKQSKKAQRSLVGALDKEFHLLYGAAFGGAHGKMQVAVLQPFPAPGQLAQLGDEEPRQGLVIPGGQAQFQGFVQGLDLGAGVDEIMALSQLPVGGYLLVELAGDFSDDLFQQVFDGDNAYRAAIFVHHHRQVTALPLHLSEQPVDLFHFRHVLHRSDEGLNGALAVFLPQKVEAVEHSDEVVDASVKYRQAGEASVAEFLPGLLDGQGVRNSAHPDEGNHHLFDGTQAELEDTVDEEALGTLQVHFRTALGHHQAQILPGDEGHLAGLADPGGQQDRPAEATEDPDNGREYPEEQPQGRGQALRQYGGLLPAYGFRDDFPQNQDQGGEGDHHRDLGSLSEAPQEKSGHQDGIGRRRQVSAQQGGRQVVLRPPQELQGQVRTPMSLLGPAVQAAAVGGDQGDLRRREDPFQEQERDEDEENPEIHGCSRRTSISRIRVPFIRVTRKRKWSKATLPPSRGGAPKRFRPRPPMV